MVNKKEKKLALAKLRKGRLLRKAKQVSLVINVPKQERSEPKSFFKKVVEEDRRNFFFR